MRRVLVLMLLAGSLPAADVAHARHERIAASLREDPVYVARDAKPSLSRAEAGRIRLRIVRRDIGRIKIAVVSARTAAEAGGTAGLSNAIDRELGAKGNLVVVAGGSIHLITSYPQVGPAVNGLRGAVQRNQGRPLDVKLLAAVDALAEADPGPEADGPEGGGGLRVPSQPSSSPASSPNDAADEVLGVFRLAVLLVAAAIALPFVLLGGWLLLRLRRRRAEEAEVLEEDRQAARDELIALGEEIRALDLDVAMPNAPASGRQAYEQALRQYELADGRLPKAKTARRLGVVKGALAEGRRQIEAAKRLLGSGAG